MALQLRGDSHQSLWLRHNPTGFVLCFSLERVQGGLGRGQVEEEAGVSRRHPPHRSWSARIPSSLSSISFLQGQSSP